jgi:excisionase family DNA binding protein
VEPQTQTVNDCRLPSEKSRQVQSLLISAAEVAALIRCSQRHIWRLLDAGRMPAAVRVGALVRWNRQAIEKWIEAGCPPARKATRT